MDLRLRREAADVVHGEDQRPVDQAMQHQPVLRRIDGRDAAMMAFVEQPVRRDDAVEILQRRPSGRREILRQILRDVLDDALLERRWRSIGLASHRIAGRLHPFGNVGRKVVGIPPPPGLRCRRDRRHHGPAHQGTAFAQKTPARCVTRSLSGSVGSVIVHLRGKATFMEPTFMKHRHEVVGNLEIFQGKAFSVTALGRGPDRFPTARPMKTLIGPGACGMPKEITESFSKVPEVTLAFWIIKIAATTLGETGGDTVTMTLQLGLSRRHRAVSCGAAGAGRLADRRPQVPSVPLLGDDHRIHHLRHHHGRFRRSLARHRLHRRFVAAARLFAGHARPLVLDASARSRSTPSPRRRWRRSTGPRSRSRRRWARRSATGWPIRPASAMKAARWCSAPPWPWSQPSITGRRFPG